MQLVLVIVGAIVVTAIAQRRELQPALVITLVALAVSLIPGLPRLEIDSEVILGVVVPPLLYSASLDFSLFAFFRKLGPILVLGVGLVVVTALVVGVVGAWVVPALTTGAAIVLGSVVAPPDAVSAVAIGRELGLRRRVLSVLTGESLVNDAAALTVFAVAVASVSGRHTFIDNPVVLFLYASAAGIAVGLAIAMVTLTVRRALDNPGLETVLGLVVPFAAYLMAEQIEASGVLAVVTAGFVIGTLSVRFGYETRLKERQVWDAVSVLLEAFVFAYVGLQLRFVLDELHTADADIAAVLGGAALILLVVIVIRPLWIFLTLGAGLVVEDRPDDPGVIRAQRQLARVNARREARGHRPASAPEPLTLREAVVVAWTGMRGVVTLAAAAGIPATLENGDPFPGREEIQVIAFVVAVGTLLIQGATLPALIRRLDVQDPAEEEVLREQRRAAEDVARDASKEVYARFVADPPPDVDPEFVERASQRLDRQREATANAFENAGPAMKALGDLMREVIAGQRKALVEGVRDGTLDDEAVRELIDQLDLQEAAFTSRLESRL